MKRNFYFFRHGQTNENQSGKQYGANTESYLTETGVAQAEKLRDFLSDKEIQVVYSSPLQRAIHTAEIALNNPNVEIITDARLIETAFGFWYAPDDENQTRINENFNRIKSCLDDIIKNDKNENLILKIFTNVNKQPLIINKIENDELSIESIKNYIKLDASINSDVTLSTIINNMITDAKYTSDIPLITPTNCKWCLNGSDKFGNGRPRRRGFYLFCHSRI